MLFASLIVRFRTQRAKSRRYWQLRKLIERMPEREVADIFGDRYQMLEVAYDHVYGVTARRFSTSLQ
jgi:hypothetical protein